MSKPHLPKKEVLKVIPGTIVEVAYSDTYDLDYHLVLEKPKNKKGDVFIKTFNLSKMKLGRAICHDQVVQIMGNFDRTFAFMDVGTDRGLWLPNSI